MESKNEFQDFALVQNSKVFIRVRMSALVAVQLEPF
jgi:hypothetical protein